MPNQCWNRLTVEGEGWEKFYKENTNANGILDFDISVPVGGLRATAYEKWTAEISGGGEDCNTWDESPVIEFYSRWCPPINYFRTVSKKYPALTFTLQFDEFCMDIHGTSVFKNGVQNDLNESICEHLTKAHGIKREDILSEVREYFTSSFTCSSYSLGNLRDNIMEGDWYRGLYLNNSDIDIEQEWEKFKADKKEKDKLFC